MFHYLPTFYLSLGTMEWVIVINYLLLCHCCGCLQTEMFPLTNFHFDSFPPTSASCFCSHSRSYSAASSLYSKKAFQVFPKEKFGYDSRASVGQRRDATRFGRNKDAVQRQFEAVVREAN